MEKDNVTTPEAATSTEQPIDEQKVRPEDEAQGQKADVQAQGDDKTTSPSALDPKGSVVPTSELRRADYKVPADSERPFPDQNVKPTAIENPMKDLSPKDQQHIGKLRAFAQVLAGGPSYMYKMDEKGQMTKVEKPLTGSQVAMGLIAHILGGAAAGMSEHGPGSIGRSFEKGEQFGARQAAQKKQSEQQQQDMLTGNYQRKAAILNNNLSTYMNRMAAAKIGGEWIQNGIDLASSLHEEANKLGAVKDYIWSDELEEKIKTDPSITMNNAIPVAREQRMDPTTGKTMTDSDGVPMWRTKYAMIDPNQTVTMPKDLIDKAQHYRLAGFTNSDGKNINLPTDPKMRLHFIVDTMNKVELRQNVEQYFKQLNGKSEGDTAPPKNNDIKLSDPKFDEFASAAATSKKADVGLVKAISIVEGQKNVRGPVTKNGGQAIGPMQIMPSTGKLFGYTPEQLADPKTNYAVGAALIKDLTDKYHDPKLVAAAYFGGDGAVKDGKIVNPDATDGAGNREGTSRQDYVSQVMKLYNGSDVNASAKKAGVEFNAPTPEQMRNLSEDDMKTLTKLGGFSAFFDGTPYKDDSTADKRIQEKQVDANSVSRLKALLTTKDGKLSGQPLIDTVRQQRADEQLKNSLEIKNESAIDRNQRLKDADYKRIVDHNETLIRGLIGQQEDGSIDSKKRVMVDIKTATSLRNESSRQAILQEAMRRDPSFNPAEVESKMRLFESAMASDNRQSTFGVIKTGNTSLQHMGQAMAMISEIKKKAEAGDMASRDLYSGFNKGFDYLNSHFATNPMWRKFRVEYQTGVTDYMNAVRNNQALQKEDLDELQRLSNPNMPLDNIEESMRGMAEAAVVRTLVPEDEKWQQAFGDHHPNVIFKDTLQALWAFNDPELNRRVAELKSGGTLSGSASGVGKDGQRVGDRLGISKEKVQKDSAYSGIPAGATKKAPGPDGKMHYTNDAGTEDYGVAN